MTATEHSYYVTVKREGRPDAILAVKGGTISLDTTRAPHVEATLELAVPRHWAPLKPIPSGHWEPTGAEQYDFRPESGTPMFRISAPPYRWVEHDAAWYNEPLPDPEPVLPPEVVTEDFRPESGEPMFFISTGEWVPPVLPPVVADLQDMDPRERPRVIITATRVDSEGAIQTRDFDLTLRDRAVRHADGTITLRLASDEALLSDYAPLQDDRTPLLMSWSLQAITNHVLGIVLETSLEDSSDAPLTPYWSATNLLPNPGSRDIAHAASTGREALALPTDINASPGRDYTFSIDARSLAAMTVRLGVEFRTDDGVLIATDLEPTSWPMYPENQRLTFTTRAPIGASKLIPIVDWTGSASGRHLLLTDGTVSDGEFDPGPLNGAMTSTTQYSYAWADAPWASASTRTLLVDAPTPDALVWRAGVSGLEYLRALVQSAGLRLVCDETRAWTLRPQDHIVPGEVRIAYAENLIDADDSISRDEWIDAAIARYTWTSAGIRYTRDNSFALTTPHTRVGLFEFDAPYPGPGFAEYAVRRRQHRGREVRVTSVADWDTRAEMAVKAILNGALPQTGVIRSVTFDLSRDEMTIDTQTADNEEED